jgi:hypothetical protein
MSIRLFSVSEPARRTISRFRRHEAPAPGPRAAFVALPIVVAMGYTATDLESQAVRVTVISEDDGTAVRNESVSLLAADSDRVVTHGMTGNGTLTLWTREPTRADMRTRTFSSMGIGTGWGAAVETRLPGPFTMELGWQQDRISFENYVRLERDTETTWNRSALQLRITYTVLPLR